MADEVAELKTLLQKEALLRKAAEEEVYNFKCQLAQSKKSEVCFGLFQLFFSCYLFGIDGLCWCHMEL